MNKYLEKIAERIKVNEMSPTEMSALFERFRKLPADSPEGQPGESPFYGRIELSKGTPGARETRKGNDSNYLFGKEGTSSDEYEFEFQRAFPK